MVREREGFSFPLQHVQGKREVEGNEEKKKGNRRRGERGGGEKGGPPRKRGELGDRTVIGSSRFRQGWFGMVRTVQMAGVTGRVSGRRGRSEALEVPAVSGRRTGNRLGGEAENSASLDEGSSHGSLPANRHSPTSGLEGFVVVESNSA